MTNVQVSKQKLDSVSKCDCFIAAVLVDVVREHGERQHKLVPVFMD